MPEQPSEPTDADGPLFREAYRRADDVDRAEKGPARRKAWARLVPSFLVAFVEGILRDWMMTGVATFSVIMALVGALSGDPVAAVGLIASGAIGTVLILLAWRRRWSLRLQWVVTLGVLALQIAAIVVFGPRL